MALPWVKTPCFYRTTFSRHLHSLVINGFYARDLDADDHAFLESVRERGTANGTLASDNTVLIEELEFWHMPYAVDHSVARRAGPPPARASETPEQREARKVRTNAWHARRLIREQEKAIAAAELERERCEWQAAQETRKLRALMADAEWEAAAPRKRKFGKVRKRHYVPQWKTDDAREAVIARATTEENMKALKLTKLAEAAAAKAAEEAEAAAAKVAEEQTKRRMVIAEARETVKVLHRLEQRWQMAEAPQDSITLKRRIIEMVRKYPVANFWTHEVLMQETGCNDRVLIEVCLNELVRDGQLRRMGVPA